MTRRSRDLWWQRKWHERNDGRAQSQGQAGRRGGHNLVHDAERLAQLVDDWDELLNAIVFRVFSFGGGSSHGVHVVLCWSGAEDFVMDEEPSSFQGPNRKYGHTMGCGRGGGL